ncbi:hypothetical protein Q1695_000727 [Nippostrongylus brasiliensis]|nr:hypothetical protein Q1695_000727 [Nippostrongylus brasiliensis]
MFMRNGYASDAPFSLNGTNISECSSYVYLGREVNMINDLSPELSRRKRAAWGAFKSVEEVLRKTKNARHGAHLFDSTVLPALTYASESWALRKQDEHARDGMRSSELRRQSKIRDAVAWAKLSKISCGGHVSNGFRPTVVTKRDFVTTVEREPLLTGFHGTSEEHQVALRWSDFFVESLNDRFDALRVPRSRRTDWSTMARDRDEWRRYWRSLERIDDQRDDR